MGHASAPLGAATAQEGRSRRLTLELASAAAIGVALTAVTAAVTAANTSGEGAALAAVARASTVAVPIAVGLYAWKLRPTERFGRLLVAVGVGWFLTTLAQSDDELAFSIGRVAGWAMEVGLVYVILAFPTGYLHTRADRALVLASLALVGLLYLPTSLLVQFYPEPSPWTSCGSSCPENAFFLLGSEPAFVDAVIAPLRQVLTMVLFLAVTAWLVRRVRHASELMRRTLLPVLTVAIARLVVFAVAIATRQASPGSPVLDALMWVLALGVPALAAAFFVGLVERRLYVADALQALGLRSRADLPAGQLRDALSDALEDPSLELVHPVGVTGGWVDSGGRALALGTDDDRVLTEIRDGDRVVAGIVHDAALRNHGDFVEAVAAYALIALENRRLSAEVEASLHEVSESRARIVASADRERRRIERDLHDGAQQRLVALGIQLELTDELLVSDPAAGRARLHALQADIAATLEEIRALAHGVYPPLLVDRGLADAIRSAAHGLPVPATVAPDGIGRYPQEVESAVYFCCLEAMQNVSKHAQGATAVAIVLEQQDELRFEVRDDGCGFAAGTTSGHGLTNMRDRLAAIGGRIEVRSELGAGTVVIGSVPRAETAPPERDGR